MQRVNILLFVAVILLPALGFSKIYKCKDSTGKIIYQDKECSEDFDVEEVLESTKYEYVDDNDLEEDSDSYEFEIEPEEEYRVTRYYNTIEDISDGQRVYIKKHLVDGKITAFMFHAKWCGACKKIMPKLENMANNTKQIALRRVDIADFNSPVAKQYDISSVPYFIIYDEYGNQVSKGSSRNLYQVVNSN